MQAAARDTPARDRPESTYAMQPLDDGASGPNPLEEIFARHGRALFRAAYRITGDAADAEDVVQTVFYRLARREDGLGLIEPVGSYLHRAAVNAALDLLRGRRRERRVGLDDVGDRLAEPNERGPEAQRANRELAVKLRLALTALTPRQSEIFTLRYFEGLSNLEISRALRCTQTAVAVILHRARHRLQRELGRSEGGLS